jgi:hypothetical protein
MPIPLPKPDCAKDTLYHMQNGQLIWELLETALKLKFFDHTQEPVSVQGLALELKAHRGNLEFFMDALASLNFFFNKKGNIKTLPWPGHF